MIQVPRENRLYRVELDECAPTPPRAHRSLGLYRVVERGSGRLLFETPNRDKSFGVFEYLTKEARIS
jgi:hypothetical protein